MYRLSLFIVLVYMVACQSAPEKRRALVQDRIAKLSGLGSPAPMRCLILAHLTDPATARYTKLFPDDALDTRAMTFDYRVDPNSCEVKPLEPGAVTRNYQSFLHTALCVLLQSHFVNSPFDGIEIADRDIEAENKDGERVRIRRGGGDLGLYLEPDRFDIETRTRARGIFKAAYTEQGRRWLPSRVEQIQGKSRFVIDQLQYDLPRRGGRTLLRSFDISLAEAPTVESAAAPPVKQSRVELTDCRADPN